MLPPLCRVLPMQHTSATASYIYIYILCWTHNLIHGFNLDLLKPTIYSGPNDSDFGYSVTLSINDFRGSQVLIGAPRANTTALLNNNVLNGGAVYRCPVGEWVKTVATTLASMGVVIHLPPWYTWSVCLDFVSLWNLTGTGYGFCWWSPPIVASPLTLPVVDCSCSLCVQSKTRYEYPYCSIFQLGNYNLENESAMGGYFLVVLRNLSHLIYFCSVFQITIKTAKPLT